MEGVEGVEGLGSNLENGMRKGVNKETAMRKKVIRLVQGWPSTIEMLWQKNVK
jgi:hypothetical protein